MDFPTDEEYKEFVDKLNADLLRLTTGNCGIFAYALKEVFKCGKIVRAGYYSHLLLEYNGKYYDGERIYNSYNELKNSMWGSYIHRSFIPDLEAQLGENTFNEIYENTCGKGNKDEFIDLIRTIISEIRNGNHDFEPNINRNNVGRFYNEEDIW